MRHFCDCHEHEAKALRDKKEVDHIKGEIQYKSDVSNFPRILFLKYLQP